MTSRTAAYVFDRMRPITEPCGDYGECLLALRVLPPGYAQCFAFHFAEADTGNGGLEQLHHNSTWSLVPKAVEACETVGAHDLARVFREVVQHYHELGACGMDEEVCRAIRAPLRLGSKRTLDEIEDEFFAVEAERYSIVQRLVAMQDTTLWGESDPPIAPRELTDREKTRREEMKRLMREWDEENKHRRTE